MLEKTQLYGKSRWGRRAGAVRWHIHEDQVIRPVSFERSRASLAGTAGVYGANWRRTSVFMFTVLAFQIAILRCFQDQAQTLDTTLSGRITSSSGTPVPNARLIIKNGTSSDTKSVTVNSDGTYLVTNLLPGTYEITASARGFEDAHATVAISPDGPRSVEQDMNDFYLGVDLGTVPTLEI